MKRADADFDLLVVANPSWERSWLVAELPVDSFDPASAIQSLCDGGGSAMNTACALARAGRRVVAAGRVGDDEAGRLCIDALGRRGVVPRIEVIAGRTTKANDLFVRRRDSATAFRATIPPDCVPPWEEEPPRLFDTALLHLDRLAAASIRWLEQRHARGLGNYLNLNAPLHRPPAMERFRAALPFIEFLQIPEGTESVDGAESVTAGARTIFHSPSPSPPLSGEQIMVILGAGPSALIRTRGADGVRIDCPESPEIRIAAIPTQVVDPTGAGDAFAAGWIDAILEGAGFVDAARRGVDWAARACRHLGARAWLDHEPPEVE